MHNSSIKRPTRAIISVKAALYHVISAEISFEDHVTGVFYFWLKGRGLSIWPQQGRWQNDTQGRPKNYLIRTRTLGIKATSAPHHVIGSREGGGLPRQRHVHDFKRPRIMPKTRALVSVEAARMQICCNKFMMVELTWKRQMSPPSAGLPRQHDDWEKPLHCAFGGGSCGKKNIKWTTIFLKSRPIVRYSRNVNSTNNVNLLRLDHSWQCQIRKTNFSFFRFRGCRILQTIPWDLRSECIIFGSKSLKEWKYTQQICVGEEGYCRTVPTWKPKAAPPPNL